MKVVMIVLFVLCFLSVSAEAGKPRRQVLDAIEQQESGCNPNVPPGDNGAALGPFQIHEGYWEEGCRFLGVTWDYETCALDEDMSRSVCEAYLSHYGDRYRRITGKEPTDEVYVRMHNGGGPSGWKRKSTLSYWHGVKRYLSD